MKTFDGTNGLIEIRKIQEGDGLGWRLVVENGGALLKVDLTLHALYGLLGESLDEIVSAVGEQEWCPFCHAQGEHLRGCDLVQSLVGALREIRPSSEVARTAAAFFGVWCRNLRTKVSGWLRLPTESKALQFDSYDDAAKVAGSVAGDYKAAHVGQQGWTYEARPYPNGADPVEPEEDHDGDD